jgi:hypothetical protein
MRTTTRQNGSATFLVVSAAATAWLMLGASQHAQSGAPLSPTDSPIVLFNGEDLSGFRTWLRDTQHDDPRRVFSVERDNGTPVIHITGDGYGGLVTTREYTNYRLVAEYRWGDRTWGDRLESPRDAGILVHGQGPHGGSSVQVVDGRSPWLTSFEFQIEEGTVGDFLVLGGEQNGEAIDIAADVEVEWHEVTSPNGTTRRVPLWKRGGETQRFRRGPQPGGNRAGAFTRDLELVRTKGTRGRNDVDTPGKGWTRVEIIADGDSLTHIVNGITVLEASRVTPTSGRIQIQSEQAEIYYRRIELLPLDTP